jgi:hypothetical protein
MSADGGLSTYRGNCHCGAFVYEVKLPEITSYTECNCSICRKKGYAYLIPNQLDIVKGSVDELSSYTFNEGRFVHRFCRNCGTGVLVSSPEKTIINVSEYTQNSKPKFSAPRVWVYAQHFCRREPCRILTCGPSMSSRKLCQDFLMYVAGQLC